MNNSAISIKIQDGCSQKCSYCIVRLLRGASISIPYQTIHDDIIFFSQTEQSKHVFLSAVNSLEYYDPLVGDYFALLQKLITDFPDMLFSLECINPLFTNKLINIIDLIKNNPSNLDDHFCISIQSASDTLLKSMRRPYNKETLTKIFDHAKSNNMHINTEIIVGFPGETEEDFIETYNFLEKYEFDFSACVFSPRPGTEASTMQNNIPESTIIARMNKYRALKEKFGYNNYKGE